MARNAVKNMRVMLNDIHEGNRDKFTAKSISMLEKSLKNLQENASEKSKQIKIDLSSENFDLNAIYEMIDEFKAIVTNENDIWNVNISQFKIIDETGSSTCELCRASHNCKYLFRITNKITKNHMYVGSQCIKKFEIPVYMGGERVEDNKIDKVLNSLETFSEEYRHTEINKIFDFCNQNNEIILSTLKKVPYVVFGGNEKIAYREIMDEYSNAVASIYRAFSTDDSDIEELKKEAGTLHSFLYTWSDKMGSKNYVTFIPGVELILYNNLRYQGIFKIVLSYLIAYNIKNKNKRTDMSTVYNVIKKIKPIRVKDFNLIYLWCRGRSDIDTEEYKDNDLNALLITLPENEECEEALENLSKGNQAVSLLHAIYNKCKKYIELMEKNNSNSDIYYHFKAIFPYIEARVKFKAEEKEAKKNKRAMNKLYREKHGIKHGSKKTYSME